MFTFIERGRAERAAGLRASVERILADEGLTLPRTWGLEFQPDGGLSAYDSRANDPTTPRASRHGLHIERGEQRPDDALLPRLLTEARGAVRRALTMPEIARAGEQGTPADGWAALCHPLPISICRSAGMPSVHLPFARIDLDESLAHGYSRRFSLMSDVEWDVLGIMMRLKDDASSGGVGQTTDIVAKPGGASVSIWQDIPEIIAASAAGRPLADLMTIEPCGDAPIDAAVAGLVVHEVQRDVSAYGNPIPGVTTIRLRPARLLPWGDPPPRHRHVFEACPEFR